MSEPLDLDAIAEEWLQQCGCCDAGLPMGCSCSKGDPRPEMAALVDEVKKYRGEAEQAERAAVIAAARAIAETFPLNGELDRDGRADLLAVQYAQGLSDAHAAVMALLSAEATP